MKLMNPSGLWLLIGIPILILIYIIKSKHEERAVASTYIWKLSERFMKQSIPLQRLKKLLIFLAQLLTIAAISLMASKPVLMKGEAVHYIVILDASASMQTKNDEGKSRFDRAIEAIETLAGETENGHTISLILASDTASCIFSRSDSEASIKRALVNVSCGEGTANLEAAVTIAQDLVVKNMTQSILLFTDREAGENENITVVNLAEEEWNVSVNGMTYTDADVEKIFTAAVTDTRSETLTVGIRINGRLKDAVKLTLTAGKAEEVSFTLNIKSFDTAEIYVEVEDGLSSDNSYAICRSGSVSAGVLIYSQSAFYLEHVFAAQDGCTVTVAAPGDDIELSGYDLYVFDGVVPEELPTDGSILYIHTETLPEGIMVQKTVEKEGSLTVPGKAEGSFYDNLSFKNTVVSRYDSLTGNSSWKTLLECGDEPVLMAKSLQNGLKLLVLSFDIHDSNLPLQTSFVILVRNILQYSVQQILEDPDVSIGESVSLTVLPGAEALYVKLPDGSAEQLTAKGLYAAYVPSRTGIYTAVEKTEKGGEYMDFFVHLPESELSGDAVISGLSVSVPENSSNQESAKQKLVAWAALVILALVLGEWGGYYYEQF